MQYTSVVIPHCDATLLSLLDDDTELQAFHLFHCLMMSFHRISNLCFSSFFVVWPLNSVVPPGFFDRSWGLLQQHTHDAATGDIETCNNWLVEQEFSWSPLLHVTMHPIQVTISVLPTPAHHSHCFVVTLSYTKIPFLFFHCLILPQLSSILSRQSSWVEILMLPAAPARNSDCFVVTTLSYKLPLSFFHFLNLSHLNSKCSLSLLHCPILHHQNSLMMVMLNPTSHSWCCTRLHWNLQQSTCRAGIWLKPLAPNNPIRKPSNAAAAHLAMPESAMLRNINPHLESP